MIQLYTCFKNNYGYVLCQMKNDINLFTSPKTNRDTQNDGLAKVDSLKKMAILGIYVRFLECPSRLFFSVIFL